MYPRRGYDCWFPETGRLHEQFWHEGPHEQFWRDEPHPNWNQCHPEQQREHSQWKQDNYYNHDFPRNFESGGNYSVSVPYRGSYRRRPRGNFHQKSHHRGRFNKRPKSSFSKESGDFGRSSRSSTLINVTTDKKESDSVKAEAPSAAPKETEPDQTESAALAKQSNSFQVRTKASKVVISASDFNFRLPHDSLALPQSKQELPLKKPEEIKVEPVTACPKAEDGHRQAPCVLAVPLSSSVTLENLRPLKEEKNIEVQPCTITSHTDQSKLHQGGFLRHQESVPRKISKLQIQRKSRQTAKNLSHCTTPLTSIEAPAEQQTLFKTAKYFHSMEKEESVQLQAAEDLPHQPASLLSSEAPIEEQRPAEITEGAYSVKKEEPSLLEDRQPTHHFNSSVLMDIPFLFDSTGDPQSEKNEETEPTQMAGSHENGDHNQTSVAVASGSSNFLTTGSDVHSVPVLVGEKDIDLTNFWETPSVHAEHLRGWAPEDYQEPPQSQDKADKCGRMPDHKRDLALHHSSSSTHVSCDKKSDTRRLVEGCSCSPKRHRSGDSRHSSKSQAPRELRVQSLLQRGKSPPRLCRSPLRSPPRRGRNPPRQHRSPPRSPPRRGRSPPRSLLRRGRSPHRSPPRRGRSPLRSPPRQGRSPPQRSRSLLRSPPRRGRSPPQSPPQLGWSPPQSLPRSPPEEGWSPPQSSLRSPPQGGWSPLQSSLQSPPQRDWSPTQSFPRRDWGSPESPPRQDYCHLRDLQQLPRKPTHEKYQEKDFPSLYSAHKMYHHYSPKEGSKSCRMPHSYSPESPTVIKAREAQTPASADSVSLDVEAENIQPARRKESQLIQMADGSEVSDIPCQHARDETGLSAQPRASSDRSAAVLARKEEIEQAYQQVLLNFAAVATMLLETQPCMMEAMETALQATLRKFGTYYECKLKDFIDHFDLA